MTKTFTTRKAALDYLKNTNPLASVIWGDMCAIYWNGKISVQKVDHKKIWL